MKIIQNKVELGKIVIDESLYPRNGYDWQTAYNYSESMKCGQKFPAITLAKMGDDLVLVDGRHRLEAYKILLGAKKFKVTKQNVEIILYANKEELYEEAVKRNIRHGRSFSYQEKVKIIATLKDLKYDLTKISSLVFMEPGKLRQIIQNNLAYSITGESIPLKNTVGHLKGSTVDEEFKEIQKGLSGKSQISLITELITLLKNNLIDKKNKQVMKKLKELKKLL